MLQEKQIPLVILKEYKEYILRFDFSFIAALYQTRHLAD